MMTFSGFLTFYVVNMLKKRNPTFALEMILFSENITKKKKIPRVNNYDKKIGMKISVLL